MATDDRTPLDGRNGWPGWATPLMAATAFVVIAYAEWRRPLREQREPKARRISRNFTTAALTAALQIRLLQRMIRRVERERLGILNQIAMPQALRVALGVVLLDYSLWWWHFANHCLQPLWRFHLVHHIDRDLDASTAIRFHFGEMSLSVFYRMAQVRLLGVGIHHSDYQEETDRNWSSSLSGWDWLHGAMRLDVEQSAIEIGVPAYQHAEDVTLGKITARPFAAQRDDWKTIDGEFRIERAAPVGEPELLR
jgi:sterol desaturase/sphingolipid hydroxylase (fatty acid hydroxylase superfamily)